MKLVKHLLFLLIGILCTSWQQVDTPLVLEKRILPHPRLLFSKQDEQRVKKMMKTTPLLQNLQTALIRNADYLLKTSPQVYELHPDYGEILQISRRQVGRIITLSLAYRLTGKSVYLEKAEKELINVCNFPDWDPKHFLDAAEMTTAVAIGYDWLYYDLQKNTKELIINSIQNKGLNFVLKEYANGGSGSWAKRDTNWNVVCNTGMVMGAMALAEENPALTEHIIRNAVKHVPNCLQYFAPDGVCYEGPAYWGYTNIYLSLLMSTLNMNFQTDYGISQLEGVSKAALFYVHTISPSGRPFNFADSNPVECASPDKSPIYFFFSKHFNQPEVATFYRKLLSESLHEENLTHWYFLCIPWFDNATCPPSEQTPKLRIYKSINDIAIFNGDRKKTNALYVAAKGGEPARAHQQMDIGSFILETNGVRWAEDMGSDNYALPGFWGYAGERWKYLRNSNLGHNTLSLDGKLQNWRAKSKIIHFDTNAAQPSCTLDMTEAYPDAHSIHRTFTLLNDETLQITDSIHLTPTGTKITWNMMTMAEVKCEGNKACLSKDGKKFYLQIISPANAVFTTKAAQNTHEKEWSLEGNKHLQITFKGEKKEVIKVILGSTI